MNANTIYNVFMQKMFTFIMIEVRLGACKHKWSETERVMKTN